MTNTRIVLVAVASFAVLSLAACGEKTVSSEDLSAQTKSSLEESVGAPLKSVDCPETKAEVGQKFACDGTTPNGDEIKIEGKITEVDDSGNVAFNVEVVSP